MYCYTMSWNYGSCHVAAFDRLEIICILFAGLEIILFMIDGNNPLFKGYKFVHLHNCFTCFHYITTALLDFTIVDKCGIRLQAMHHARHCNVSSKCQMYQMSNQREAALMFVLNIIKLMYIHVILKHIHVILMHIHVIII